MSPPSIFRPIRAVLKWQLVVTAVLSLIAGVSSGKHGALSAALGGVVNLTAGAVYAALLWMGTAGGRSRGAHMALYAMLRAEAGKVLAIVAQLWFVLSTYRELVPAAFFSAFVLTVIVFSMAFFVRD